MLEERGVARKGKGLGMKGGANGRGGAWAKGCSEEKRWG